MASIQEEESDTEAPQAETQICGSIIPGLPDDISIRCLAKLGSQARAAGSCVSRSWKTALHPTAMTSEVRLALGVSGDNYLFMSFLHRENGKILLQRYLVDLVQMQGRPISDPLSLPHVTVELPESARYLASRGLLADQLDGYANLILHLEQSSFKNFNYYPPVSAVKGKLFLLLEYAEFAYEVNLMLGYAPHCKNNKIDVWSVLPSMNVRRRRCFVCGSLGKYIYVAGGLTNENLENAVLGSGKRSAERFDTEKNQWEVLPALNRERVNAIGFVLDGRFYVMGGGKGSRTSGEFYDPDAGKWILVPKIWPKPTYLSYFTRDVAVVENKLYAKKLSSEETYFSLSVWEYNKRRNRWSNLGVVVRHISKLVLCDYRLVRVGEELWVIGMKPDAEPGFNVLACRPSERAEGEEGLKWRRLELGWDKHFVLLLSCFAF